MTMKASTSAPRGPAKGHPPGSLAAKLRKRGLFTTVATFAGSGWLLYEIVHFILVDHYGFPHGLKDVAIVTVLGAMISTLTWRWFRGGKGPRKTKWEYILVPVFIAGTAAIDIGFLTHLGGHDPDPFAAAVEGSAWTNSIAVLPFVNMSSDKEQDYFCDGLTEEMISRLSQIRGLKVTARTSAFAFKGDNRDVREIGRRLGVEKVLEGSVRKDAASVRITAQLIQVSDGFHIWSGSFDRDLDAVLSVQDEIAGSVATAMEITLLESPGAPPQTGSLEAYNEFLLGQHAYAAATKENLEKAIDHYGRAVEIDPRYARAWAGLAAALAFHAGLGFAPTGEGYPKASAAVERALALDDTLAYGYIVKGWIQMTFDWDWAGAEASYAKALRLEPSRGYYGASQLALALGRFEPALDLARRAADLDTLSASTQMNLGLAAYYAGRLEEAAEVFSKVALLHPGRADVHALLAQVYLARSDPRSALRELEKERDPLFRLPVLAMCYHALGRAGDSYEALGQLIQDHSEGGAYQIAQAYAYLGERNEAFEWLEIAYRQRDGGLFLTKADPYLKSLRPDPRFAAFLKKMGFPAEPDR